MKIKFMTLEELRSAKPAEITKYIHEMQKHRIGLLEQIHTGKSKQTHLLSKMKRSVATAKLVQSENITKEKQKKEEKK